MDIKIPSIGPILCSFTEATHLKIKAMAKENPAWKEMLDTRLPYIGAEVVWATRHEMARTVEDVLARRLRALFLDARAAMDMAPAVARI